VGASSPRDRILFLLKTRGPQSASELAEQLERTPVAVRQHLARLEEEGLVEAATPTADGVGRPARIWTLTAAAAARFPEGYAELALDVIDSVRAAFGPEALDRLIAARTQRQIATYAEELARRAATSLGERVHALADLRTRDGYMAEVAGDASGALTLIENNCPICAAARICAGICGGELDLFRALLPDAAIERTEHILDGARRCAYRITGALSPGV